MKRQQADPNKEWKSITKDHGEAKNKLEKIIKELKEEEPNDPRAIVGPYRTGKTQLLYTVFKKAWEEDVPALYVDARDIFKQADPDKGLIKWIEDEIKRQIKELADGNKVDWLPNFNTDKDINEFLEKTSQKNLRNPTYTILLVDEVEQAYTDIKEIGELIEVDDDNPLRRFLDKTTGVYQIWSFGLISSFEFLGDADDGRFVEIRIPSLDVKKVYNFLEDEGVNPELANAIWWLSRGRIGQINKFSREISQNSEDLSSFIEDKSRKEFNNTKIINPIWEKYNLLPDEIDKAKKSVIFAEKDFEDWTVSYGECARGQEVKTVFKNILIENTSISQNAKNIIDDQLNLLIPAFAPADSWIEEKNKYITYLPINIFYDEENIEGMLSLLQDFTATYIKSHSTREEVINLIQEADSKYIKEKWIGEIQEYSKTRDGWSVKPQIIDEAYPAVVIDPDKLTKKPRKSIEEDMDEGIEILPDFETPHTDFKIYLCPKKEIFKRHATEIMKSLNIKEVTMLITPLDSDWELNDEQKILSNHKKLFHKSLGVKRIWDFAVKLDWFLKENFDEYGPYDYEVIKKVVKNVEDGHKKTTIRTLFSELNGIVQNASEEASDEFIKKYSRDDQSVPVWGEDILDSEDVYWQRGKSGSLSSGFSALSYGFVFSREEINPDHNYSNIRQYLINAYENDLMKGNFKLKEFLDNVVLKRSGFGKDTRTERQKYLTAGNLTPAIKNLQMLIDEMIDPTGQDLIVDSITNVENDTNDVPVLRTPDFKYEQAPVMIWGLLLDWYATNNTNEIGKKLQNTIDKIKVLENDVDQLKDELKKINQSISPPDDLEGGVKVEYKILDDYTNNISGILKTTKDLKQRLNDNKNFSTIALGYQIILERYENLCNKKIEEISNEINTQNIQFIDKLNSKYNSIKEDIKEKNEKITKWIDYTENELIEEFKNYCKDNDLFNYEDEVIGGSTVQLGSEDDSNPIDEIDKFAEEKVKEIEEIRDFLDEIIDEFEEVKEKKDDTIEAMYEFLEIFETKEEEEKQ